MKLFQLFYKTLIIIAFAVIFQTCVDPISFDRNKKENELVVDGRINANDSVQTVRLTRTDVVGKSSRFPTESGASITLFENSKLIAAYNETEPGVYQIFNFKPKVGNTYHIEFQLKNGERYMSLPEIVPQPVPIEAAYFTFDSSRTLTLFSQVTIPTQGDVPYLRWQIKHVYQRTDINCGMFDNIATCYYELNRATDNQLVPLLDGSEFGRGAPVQASIVDAPVVDSIFGEVTYYTIFQESLTSTTYQYWQKVNTLLTQTGSIFDAPPGQVRGNIYKVNEPDALVLGIFYATTAEIAYVKTFPSDFAPLQLAPYCGIAGVPPSPFPFPECCYCTPGIPRPDYWR